MQFGHFRRIALLQRRLFSPGKLPLPGFAPRLLRMLHPFPARKRRCLTFPCPLQFLLLRLQALHQFLQSQRVDLQPLEVGALPHQFQFQFGDPLIFRTRLRVLIPFATYPAKFTAFHFLRSESFDLHFSEV